MQLTRTRRCGSARIRSNCVLSSNNFLALHKNYSLDGDQVVQLKVKEDALLQDKDLAR